MVTDIPNIYPYIVDDIGEGIQAKRRGRGVVIDHLTPALKEGGHYQEYLQLYEMINSYNSSLAMESRTAPLKLKEIEKLTRKLGIVLDLGITVFGEDAVEEIEHYLLEIKENFMPFGLHTFGKSPGKEALLDTVKWYPI